MTTANPTKSHNDNAKTKRSISGYNVRSRARRRLTSVRREATAPRLAAAAAVGALAAAAGFLSSASRRESLTKGVQGLRDRALGTNHDAITGNTVGAAPGA